MQLRKLKVKRVTESSSLSKVHDITVENVHHYALENGVISHNSGAIYNASIIVEFHKAGLKDGDNDASQINSKSGIVVTSKVVKSRFARPIPIKFHISFFKGMNPYVGLENYVTWENCGIGRGELVEEILETPIFEADGVTPKMYRGKPKIERTKTGNVTYKADPKATTFAVKHLGKTVKGSEVFTSAVFTDEILQMLDEKVIRPIFELPKVVSDENDLEEELFGETDSFNEEVPTEIQEQVQGLAETLASKHEDNENDN